jgi:hypothetical protein
MGDNNMTWFFRMLELLMVALAAGTNPPIPFQPSDNIPAIHIV